jgi:hypothetical protein
MTWHSKHLAQHKAYRISKKKKRRKNQTCKNNFIIKRQLADIYMINFILICNQKFKSWETCIFNACITQFVDIYNYSIKHDKNYIISQYEWCKNFQQRKKHKENKKIWQSCLIWCHHRFHIHEFPEKVPSKSQRKNNILLQFPISSSGFNIQIQIFQIFFLEAWIEQYNIYHVHVYEITLNAFKVEC